MREPLSASAQLEAVTNDSETCIYIAARDGHRNAVQHLLAVGAKIDSADINGLASLHAAAGYGRLAVVKLLISTGSQIDVINGTRPPNQVGSLLFWLTWVPRGCCVLELLRTLWKNLAPAVLPHQHLCRNLPGPATHAKILS